MTSAAGAAHEEATVHVGSTSALSDVVDLADKLTVWKFLAVRLRCAVMVWWNSRAEVQQWQQ